MSPHTLPPSRCLRRVPQPPLDGAGCRLPLFLGFALACPPGDKGKTVFIKNLSTRQILFVRNNTGGKND